MSSSSGRARGRGVVAFFVVAVGCGGASEPTAKVPIATPKAEAPAFAPASLACGDRHTCALASGAVYCWGLDEDGQLGDGGKTSRPSPVRAIASGATSVAAGEGHTCVIVAGEVLCFGDDSSGEAGVPGSCPTCEGPDVTAPTKVPGLSDVRAVALGGDHTCAIVGDDGKLLCWGANDHGQLGLGGVDAKLHPTPTVVPGLAHVREVALGTAHTCALVEGGAMSCFGDNALGQLGDGSFVGRASPTTVAGLHHPPRAIAAGYATTCAISDDGTASCWGKTDMRIDDVAAKHGRARPAIVDGVFDVAAIDVGADRTCARHEDGTVSCWSNHTVRKPDDPRMAVLVGAAKVEGLAGVRELSVGMQHACARLAGGEIECWGENDDGQLGDGTRTDSPKPIVVRLPTDATPSR